MIFIGILLAWRRSHSSAGCSSRWRIRVAAVCGHHGGHMGLWHRRGMARRSCCRPCRRWPDFAPRSVPVRDRPPDLGASDHRCRVRSSRRGAGFHATHGIVKHTMPPSRGRWCFRSSEPPWLALSPSCASPEGRRSALRTGTAPLPDTAIAARRTRREWHSVRVNRLAGRERRSGAPASPSMRQDWCAWRTAAASQPKVPWGRAFATLAGRGIGRLAGSGHRPPMLAGRVSISGARPNLPSSIRPCPLQTASSMA